jgi:hypothetical protein
MSRSATSWSAERLFYVSKSISYREKCNIMEKNIENCVKRCIIMERLKKGEAKLYEKDK